MVDESILDGPIKMGGMNNKRSENEVDEEINLSNKISAVKYDIDSDEVYAKIDAERRNLKR